MGAFFDADDGAFFDANDVETRTLGILFLQFNEKEGIRDVSGRFP